MKIGIIVYSQTENSYSVAKKLEEKLKGDGNEATVERVTTVGKSSPGSGNIELRNSPSVDNYDMLVFGSPVQAFSLAKPMAVYLQQLPSLKDKKVACFVTKQLPFHWTGGKQAVATMKKICEAKGAIVCGSEIVIWSKTSLDQIIGSCLESMCKDFT